MKSIRQLIRQPMKTASGILLITLAVSILCVCLGQALAAAEMEHNLEDLFTSVALPTYKYQYSRTQDEYGNSVYEIEYHLPEDVLQWIHTTAAEHPDIVKSIHSAGLASAYIPELEAVNHTEYWTSDYMSNFYLRNISGGYAPYTQVMLEIRLDKVVETHEYELGIRDLVITGTVLNVIGLQEGYKDPTGYTARMSLTLPMETTLDDLGLVIGERYLVCGIDYQDLDWILRNDIAGWPDYMDGAPRIEEFDMDNLYLQVKGEELDDLLAQYGSALYSEQDFDFVVNGQSTSYAWYLGNTYVGYYTHETQKPDGNNLRQMVSLTLSCIWDMHAVSFTLQDTGSIVRLDGTAEEFFASEDGALWQERAEHITINNSAFAVLGVDDLMAIGDFALDKAQITAGRSFTPEELASGVRVCIISEELAYLNDLDVGDTITPQFYNYDENNPYQDYVSDGVGVINPGAYFYNEKAQFVGAGESYTIVGIYHQDMLWQTGSSYYSFTCNTIFVPKGSVPSTMDYSDTGLFLSLILEKGRENEFEELAIAAGHDGLFKVTDQGYSAVRGSLHDYQSVARQAMYIGMAVYAVIFALFWVLFPAQQGKTLTMMGRMGAAMPQKMGHILTSALGILVPGTITGTLTGMLLWQRVVDTLMQSTRAMFTLELDILSMLGIAAAQLVLASVIIFLLGLPLARKKVLMNRESLLKRLFSRLTNRRSKSYSIIIFALIASFVLCSLHAANEKEQENYVVAYQNTPVKVTLLSLFDNDAYNLGASGFTKDLFAEERFSSFTPRQYLKDIQFMASMETDQVNRRTIQNRITGITADTVPEDVEIQWLDGYDESVLSSIEYEDQFIIIVPESMKLSEYIKLTVTLETTVGISEHSDYVTVVGTHSGSEIYCPVGLVNMFAVMVGYEILPASLDVTVNTYEDLVVELTGLTSGVTPVNLSAERRCEITWFDGYDATILDSEEMVLLMPEGFTYSDMDESAPGIQVQIHFTYKVPDGYDPETGEPVDRITEYECLATVAGTYTNSIASQEIYCPFYALNFCAARVGYTLGLDHISATMTNNDQIDDLRDMADEWFADPDDDIDVFKGYIYILDIDDTPLLNLKTTLENSILVNQICTLMVFALTAGAGFFLGFLMIRSRKREIILMRTLGKPNTAIYRDFALEQMAAILLGTILGGTCFGWQPMNRLVIFGVVYFVGLSAALIAFLNSTLLTNVKEDE